MAVLEVRKVLAVWETRDYLFVAHLASNGIARWNSRGRNVAMARKCPANRAAPDSPRVVAEGFTDSRQEQPIAPAVPQRGPAGQNGANSGVGRRGTGPHQLPGAAQRGSASVDGHRISPAGVSDEPAGRGIQPRTTVECGVGAGSRDYGPGGGRTALAAEGGTGSGGADSDSLGARLRVHVRTAAGDGGG